VPQVKTVLFARISIRCRVCIAYIANIADSSHQPLFNVVNAPALFSRCVNCDQPQSRLIHSSFCGFLELADALCYNYCARAIKELLAIEVMPYKVGLIILNDPIAPYILKTRVLRLMHSLYILTMNSRGVDVSNVQVLIPWNMDSSVASYSIANLYPTHAEWESKYRCVGRL